MKFHLWELTWDDDETRNNRRQIKFASHKRKNLHFPPNFIKLLSIKSNCCSNVSEMLFSLEKKTDQLQNDEIRKESNQSNPHWTSKFVHHRERLHNNRINFFNCVSTENIREGVFGTHLKCIQLYFIRVGAHFVSI